MNKVFTMMLAGMLLVGSTFAFAEDVYVTKNGKKYHKADCLLIKNKGAKPITMEDAIKKGLKPCRRCFSTKDKGSVDAQAKADTSVNNAPSEANTK